MRFKEWVDTRERGALTRMQEATGLAYSTLLAAKRGEAVKVYATAKKISDATGGEVSITDLCEPGPAESEREAS